MNKSSRRSRWPAACVHEVPQLLVKMINTVGYCRKGLCYRVDRRVASQWIETGKAEPAFDMEQQTTMIGAVTTDGEPAEKIKRKRRRRRRKH